MERAGVTTSARSSATACQLPVESIPLAMRSTGSARGDRYDLLHQDTSALIAAIFFWMSIELSRLRTQDTGVA